MIKNLAITSPSRHNQDILVRSKQELIINAIVIAKFNNQSLENFLTKIRTAKKSYNNTQGGNNCPRISQKITSLKDNLFNSFVSNFRSHLVHDGIATLPNFLRNDVLSNAVTQIRSLAHKAWKTDSTHNIFLDDGDDDFPMDHIRNRRLPTTVNKVKHNLRRKQ